VLRCISRWELLQQMASGMPTDAALFAAPGASDKASRSGGRAAAALKDQLRKLGPGGGGGGGSPSYTGAAAAAPGDERRCPPPPTQTRMPAGPCAADRRHPLFQVLFPTPTPPPTPQRASSRWRRSR
jgi:hypothetical protein